MSVQASDCRPLGSVADAVANGGNFNATLLGERVQQIEADVRKAVGKLEEIATACKNSEVRAMIIKCRMTLYR